MTFPKPTGSAFSSEGANKAAEWHNWALNDYFERANAGGNVRWAPRELNRLIGDMYQQNLVNDTERGYLEQYADRLGRHYNSTTQHWDRGTSYIASLVSDIASIHASTASDPNASGDVFKAVSNIAYGSAIYWQDGGASGYDPDKLSMSALVVGDVGGAIIGGVAGAIAGNGIGDIIGGAIIGAMTGSIFGPIVGALKGV